MSTLASPNLLEWQHHQDEMTKLLLQKGDCPMLKMTLRYTRYVLAALATVGFALTQN
jgi:hypothetical protein